MSLQQASIAWQSRQAQLLKQAYTRAWQQGATAYRSQYATPPPSQTAAQSPQPTQPNALTMSRALQPALLSLARMGAAIAALTPTTARIAAAGSIMAALTLLLHEYLEANAWLLAGGISVAWAGEQAGYAEAADADGMLLEWQLDPVAHHCEDCPGLAALPPMPLEMWPTLPGDGGTECSVGCRCSMRAVAAPIVALDGNQQHLVNRLHSHRQVLIAA